MAAGQAEQGVFRVERSAFIAARPQAIYPYIADFHRWSGWSPFDKRDPDMQRSYSGAQSGEGAAYAWSGRKAGAGEMRIVEARPGAQVKIDLTFTKPMKAHNTAEFTLAPEAGGSRVTWAMYGPKPFIARLLGKLLNMDKLVGRDFEAGLANLKALAEGGAAAG